MAGALGNNSAMVLKNHGLLTAGRTIPEAVILANTMEQVAEIQLLAMSAGKVVPLSEAGSKRTKVYLRTDDRIMRGWTYWMRKLARARPEVLRM